MPTYEPGLGCPHCSDAFSHPEERARHIVRNHPGEYSGPTDDMMMVANRANVSLGDVFSDRRAKEARPSYADEPQQMTDVLGARPPKSGKILPMKQSKPTVDDLYEKHLAWSKANGHPNPDSVTSLRAHEKSGGLTRGQANKVADQQYIGGGGSDWRSQKDD